MFVHPNVALEADFTRNIFAFCLHQKWLYIYMYIYQWNQPHRSMES